MHPPIQQKPESPNNICKGDPSFVEDLNLPGFSSLEPYPHSIDCASSSYEATEGSKRNPEESPQKYCTALTEDCTCSNCHDPSGFYWG
jgi:hypothetical protein